MPRICPSLGGCGAFFCLSGHALTLEGMFERDEAKKARGVQAWIRRADRRPNPMTLPEEILSTTGERKDAFDPVPVHAVIPVSYAYTDVLAVEGEVIAWTKSAVLVRAVLEPGAQPREVWVWANAVRRK